MLWTPFCGLSLSLTIDLAISHNPSLAHPPKVSLHVFIDCAWTLPLACSLHFDLVGFSFTGSGINNPSFLSSIPSQSISFLLHSVLSRCPFLSHSHIQYVVSLGPSPSRCSLPFSLNHPRLFISLLLSNLFFFKPKRRGVDARMGVSSRKREETPCGKTWKAFSTRFGNCRVRTSVAGTTRRMIDMHDC